MTNNGDVGLQLHQIAWAAASNDPRRPVAHPADPFEDFEGDTRERQAGCILLIHVYAKMIKVLQRRIDVTVKEALACGADYADVAAACGISRQAVRQRWLRRKERIAVSDQRLSSPPSHDPDRARKASSQISPPVKVRLTGGPYDGAWDRATPGLKTGFAVELPGPGSTDTEPHIAWYVPSNDDAGIYIFAGVEPERPRSHRPENEASRLEDATRAREQILGTSRDPYREGPSSKPRVYEIAAELHVESKTVMAILQEMGVFVRSASSTVDPPIARRLKETAIRRQEQTP